MRMVLTIKEARHGLWCICSGESVLYDKLRFAHAVRLARGLACEEFASSGHAVSVEMESAGFTISLMHHVCSASSRQVVA